MLLDFSDLTRTGMSDMPEIQTTKPPPMESQFTSSSHPQCQHSFAILSPSLMLIQINQQRDQETSDRSRISA